MPDEKPQRISIGFTDGQVVAARVTPAVLTRLRQALPAAGWHALTAEDGTVSPDFSTASTCWSITRGRRVGFGT